MGGASNLNLMLQNNCTKICKMPNRIVKYPTATNARKVGNDFVVTYHETDVVIVRENGAVVLNTGGWLTATTAHRINQYAPNVQFSIRKKKGFVHYCGKTYNYYDGMILHNGEVTTSYGVKLLSLLGSRS
jgi:hypothetical protein